MLLGPETGWEEQVRALLWPLGLLRRSAVLLVGLRLRPDLTL